MNTKIGLAPTVLILVGNVALLQIHGVLFWIDHVGPMGWAWSILLECVALWLWYQPVKSIRILAFLASCLTLLGPIYHVAEPSINKIYGNQSTSVQRDTKLKVLYDERDLLKEQIATFQRNSTERTGWLGAIEQSSARLIEVNKQIVELSGGRPERETWLSQWVIIMEIIGLIIFQLAAVLAILKISRTIGKATRESADGMAVEDRKPMESTGNIIENRCAENPAGDEKTQLNQEFPLEAPMKIRVSEDPSLLEKTISEPLGVETTEASNNDPVALLERAELYLYKTGKSWAEFGKDHNISGRDLSLLKNHRQRAEAGERTVSQRVIERIAEALASVSA